jgi:hypothetical protein
MPLAPRRLAAATVLGLALLATACGGDDDSGDDATEDAAVDETTTTEAETEAETDAEDADGADDGAAAPSAELTPEGTELAIGDSATIPHDDGEGAIAVTVDGITAGTPEELAELELQGGETGDLQYVALTVTNVDAPADAGSYAPGSSSLFALQDDGQPATPVAEFSTFEPCENEDPSELAAGESFTTCLIFLASSGVPVTSVQFAAEYDSTPIVWS